MNGPAFSRPQGHGQTFPPHVEPRDAEALRGSQQLRAIDPNLIVVLDKSRHVYQVWGPSLAAGGWVPIVDCQDDAGRPYRGRVPWELIAQALVQAREGEYACDRARRENDAREAQLEREHSDRFGDALRYARRAVQGELRGYGRHSAEDVAIGFRNADEGRLKAPPKGRVIYAAR